MISRFGDTLKPCPFCGGEAAFNEDPHPECEGFWINCTQCKASTGTHYEHVDDMVSAWNLRNPIAVITPLPPLVNAAQTAVIDALNERDFFINPPLLRQAADEIDCDGSCEHIWHEGDTNASGCKRSENGEYCPNDVAETLRALAKVAETYFPTEHSQ